MSREHSRVPGRRARGSADERIPVPGRQTLAQTLGRGKPLPPALQAKFEQSVQRDLSGVRVHDDAAAAEAAAAVDARAFAVGQDIVIGAGQPDLSTREGEQLIAHEVAHTVQQGDATGDAELATTTPGDATEKHADAAAAAMLAGQPAAIDAQPVAIARRSHDEALELPSEAFQAVEARGGDAGTGATIEGATTEGATTEGATTEGATTEATTEGDGGEIDFSAERIGQEADTSSTDGEGEGEVAGPPTELADVGKEIPPHGGAEELAEGASPGEVNLPARAAGDAGGGGGGDLEAAAQAQAEAREMVDAAQTEASAYEGEVKARRDRFDSEQHATMLESIKTMSLGEKRQTLIDLGYDKKKVGKMSPAQLDATIEGKMEAEQRKTRILGMDEDELAALTVDRKIQFLADLGIDREDLDKAGAAKCERCFDDVIKASKVPGKHKVKIKIKGGLFGKSWVVNVDVDAEGGVDLQAEKKGGFFSKLFGWVKAALPIILTVLAPLTGGATLIALAVYQSVTAIIAGDWLGAVLGAAGAIAGVGAFMIAKGALGASTTFARIANVANKVKNVAHAAATSINAAKARSPGALLGALASGAAAFANFSANAAGKFATTMKSWSEKLAKWGQVVGGSEGVVHGIRVGDPVAALGGAFDAVTATADPKTGAGKHVARASRVTGFVEAGRRALSGNPPQYAQVADAALGIAGELSTNGKLDAAARITGAANRLVNAWQRRDADPTELAAAALGLAETIHTISYGDPAQVNADGTPVATEERARVVQRYQRATNIVEAAGAVLAATTQKPRPGYVTAVDAVAQLVAGFTDNKQIDRVAVLTERMDAWTRAINDRNDPGAFAAAIDLGNAINGMRADIQAERDQARQEAQAGAPGAELDGRDPSLPPGPSAADQEQALLPSRPIGDGFVPLAPALDPNRPYLPGQDEREPTGPGGRRGAGPGETTVGTVGPDGQDAATVGPVGQDATTVGSDTTTVGPDGTTIGPDATPAGPDGAAGPVTAADRELVNKALALKTGIATLRVAGELLNLYDHPGAKHTLAHVLQGVETTQAWEHVSPSTPPETLRGQAKEIADQYKKVAQSLELLGSGGRFLEAFAKEISSFEAWFFDAANDPASKRANRDMVNKLARIKRHAQRAARVGWVPVNMYNAIDDIGIVGGYDAAGKEVDMEHRALAAARLLRNYTTLPSDLRWMGLCAQTLIDNHAPALVARAVDTVVAKTRAVGAKLGAKAEAAFNTVLRPLIEKVGASEGGQAAMRVATRVATELSVFLPCVETLQSAEAFKAATTALGKTLGIAVRGMTGPQAIAFELTRLEGEWLASEVYFASRIALAHVFSVATFGRPFNALKADIRNKPDDSEPQCDALFHYLVHDMLRGAPDERVRGEWWPYLREQAARRVLVGGEFAREFPQRPVEALVAIQPPDLKIMIAAPHMKDIALDYLDKQFERVNGVRPEP